MQNELSRGLDAVIAGSGVRVKHEREVGSSQKRSRNKLVSIISRCLLNIEQCKSQELDSVYTLLPNYRLKSITHCSEGTETILIFID